MSFPLLPTRITTATTAALWDGALHIWHTLQIVMFSASGKAPTLRLTSLYFELSAAMLLVQTVYLSCCADRPCR